MAGEIIEIAPICVERVGGSAALGSQHVEEQRDQPGVGELAVRAVILGRQRGLASRSCGIVMVISRGLGSTMVASAKMAA